MNWEKKEKKKKVLKKVECPQLPPVQHRKWQKERRTGYREAKLSSRTVERRKLKEKLL